MNELESPKKLKQLPAIWLLPVVLIVFESLFFVTKHGWQAHDVVYYVSFWLIRICLTPLIIFYTYYFWVEAQRKARLIVTHLIGFLLFSFIFITIAYLFLHRMLLENDFPFLEKDSSIYWVLADNSVGINVMVYISTVIIYYVLEYSRRVIAANQKAILLERSLVNARLHLLKNQLNTHFLFNTLHTINSLVTRKYNDEASDMIIRLSDLLRYALKDDQSHLIPLGEELEMLQAYIYLVKRRLGEKLNVSLVVDEELKDYLVPAFILQPIVENAVRHAIEPLLSNGRIDVTASREAKYLRMTVSDNGQLPFNSINFQNGVGLNNTRERLQNLYLSDFELDYSPNEEQGTTVTLCVPLQKHPAYEYSDSR